MKTSVVLFNLGGPDCLDSIEPFLFNLFNDKAIISLPNPSRSILASFISSRRAKFAKEIYSQIGGKSPILEETQLQASALEQALNSFKDNGKGDEDYKVFINMRYWHPMADETARAVKEYDPDKIILMPLYPQCSTTTTFSSVDRWHESAKDIGLDKPTYTICCYPDNKGFIKAYSDLILAEYEKAESEFIEKPIVLFSAHGIPLNRIKKGDPYEFQINLSVKAVVDKLAIEDLEYSVCYQSKVGPLKWLSPSAHDAIVTYSKAGRNIVLVPISFVSEHSETLVELDIEYKKLAENNGAKGYFRVPAVRDSPAFIDGLLELCMMNDQIRKVCPKSMKKCFKDCYADH
jgi:protoporphyrin/coproporphyrin ferrochelatase